MDLSIEGLGGKGRKFGKGKVQIESDELPLLFFGSGIRFLFFGESSLEKNLWKFGIESIDGYLNEI